MDAELLPVNGGKALHLPDVGARHKRTARAGEDDHPHIIGLLHLGDGFIQVTQYLRVQGVEGFRPVDGEHRHLVLLLVLDK